jgi:hypothetical protein
MSKRHKKNRRVVAAKPIQPSIRAECESVPIDPAVREKVRKILRDRGFKQYQPA